MLHKTDSFILKVDAGKTLLPAAFNDLLIADIKAFYEIISFEKGSKEDDPENNEKNADCIVG